MAQKMLRSKIPKQYFVLRTMKFRTLHLAQVSHEFDAAPSSVFFLIFAIVSTSSGIAVERSMSCEEICLPSMFYVLFLLPPVQLLAIEYLSRSRPT